MRTIMKELKLKIACFENRFPYKPFFLLYIDFKFKLFFITALSILNVNFSQPIFFYFLTT